MRLVSIPTCLPITYASQVCSTNIRDRAGDNFNGYDIDIRRISRNLFALRWTALQVTAPISAHLIIIGAEQLCRIRTLSRLVGINRRIVTPSHDCPETSEIHFLHSRFLSLAELVVVQTIHYAVGGFISYSITEG